MTTTQSALNALKEKVGGHYDALPLLDVEYNYPEVQRVVLHLVQAEMASFSPPADQYLSSLPYPRLRFDSAPAFAASYESERARRNGSGSGSGISSGSESAHLDMRRYSVPAPREGSKDDKTATETETETKEIDVLAWRHAVNNARSQLEHQRNRLLNLELLASHGDEVWGLHVVSTQQAAQRVERLAAEAEREKHVLNSRRLSAQRAAAPALATLAGKRSEALVRVAQLHAAVASLEASHASSSRNGSSSRDTDAAAKRQRTGD